MTATKRRKAITCDEYLLKIANETQVLHDRWVARNIVANLAVDQFANASSSSNCLNQADAHQIQEVKSVLSAEVAKNGLQDKLQRQGDFKEKQRLVAEAETFLEQKKWEGKEKQMQAKGKHGFKTDLLLQVSHQKNPSERPSPGAENKEPSSHRECENTFAGAMPSETNCMINELTSCDDFVDEHLANVIKDIEAPVVKLEKLEWHMVTESELGGWCHEAKAAARFLHVQKYHSDTPDEPTPLGKMKKIYQGLLKALKRTDGGGYSCRRTDPS